MNKNELVSAVADKAGLTKVDAARAVDAVFDAVELALVSVPVADTGGGNVAAPASDSDDLAAAVVDEWGLHVLSV